ncbi:ABC transporter permease [Novosphingobium colocasiae]|uniref:Membrane protein n=1 Tax=Novosphingobium colocasiae TaxID=1256513 RepID=A0A918UJ80_9SPHN|nr:ABC transporter permease [Novosphingobium colocasiae]GGZ14353.1 membrane protein [Novosphingobium colocasiae]
MMAGADTTRRLTALIRKETRQMLRDRSNLMVGLLLPIVLNLLFGYGLSFDVRNAPVAVVLEDRSQMAREVTSGLDGSPYIDAIHVDAMADAERLVREHEAVAIVRVPSDFSRRAGAGSAAVQVILNGSDTTTANALEGYIAGAIGTAMQHRADRAPGTGRGGATVIQRIWFNEASDSTWYLVPGLLVIVITLIGALLTSLLIAREWERGTLESLFVTPVRPHEILIAKLLPYLVIGAIDIVTCLAAARFLFHVPIRGSLIVIFLAAMLYLAVSLLLGLFISGKVRNQFEASQISLLASFMPATMLSGFVFDLRNLPWPVWIVSQLVPATHFMPLLKTLFLGGNNWTMLARDSLILIAYGAVLGIATTRTLAKRLD